MAVWTGHAASEVRAALHWVARHSGVPAVLITAVAMVVSWRLFRRSLRFGVEVAVVLIALLAASRLGWVTW